MKDTSCGIECAYVKTGFCKTEKECPFFVQTLWQKDGEQTPKIVSDCFPKKFALEQNQLLHRFLCMQSVQEELRHKITNLELYVKQLCNILTRNFDTEENKLTLSNDDNLKSLE